MNSELSAQASQELWGRIEPELDELVDKLRADDRDAILLRFYQKKSMAEVGLALGCSEDAAKKRISRALEKLRQMMHRRGIATPFGAAITPLLLASITQSAPAAIVTLCTSAPSLSVSATVLGISKGAIALMMTAKTKIVLAATVAALMLPAGMGVGYLLTRSHDGSVATGSYAARSSAPPDASPTIVASPARPASRPSFSQADTLQNRAQCAENLTALGGMLATYSQDNRGAYPRDLGALISVTRQAFAFSRFLCPNSGVAMPGAVRNASRAEQAAWINANSDYVYIPGWNPGAPADIAIIYEKLVNEYEEGANVLYGDGHVSWIPANQLQAEIDKSLNSPARKK